MPTLRSAALRIASELPQGNPTRRKILAVLALRTARYDFDGDAQDYWTLVRKHLDRDLLKKAKIKTNKPELVVVVWRVSGAQYNKRDFDMDLTIKQHLTYRTRTDKRNGVKKTDYIKADVHGITFTSERHDPKDVAEMVDTLTEESDDWDEGMPTSLAYQASGSLRSLTTAIVRQMTSNGFSTKGFKTVKPRYTPEGEAQAAMFPVEGDALNNPGLDLLSDKILPSLGFRGQGQGKNYGVGDSGSTILRIKDNLIANIGWGHAWLWVAIESAPKALYFDVTR